MGNKRRLLICVFAALLAIAAFVPALLTDAESFDRLCHPRFGPGSYEALLKYIEDVKQYVPDVAVSVVSGSISREALEKCRAKAEEMGVRFKVR